MLLNQQEASNKVLLSFVWNPLLIEINLSQIMTLDINREKVCAVCPYLLLFFYLKKKWSYIYAELIQSSA